MAMKYTAASAAFTNAHTTPIHAVEPLSRLKSAIVSITPINYTYKDLATEHYVTDYGVMVVFRG